MNQKTKEKIRQYLEAIVYLALYLTLIYGIVTNSFVSFSILYFYLQRFLNLLLELKLLIFYKGIRN